jgi:hypothetical protein
MFSGWLRQKITRRTVRSEREDLEMFVASLRAQSEGDIAVVVAVAAAIRMRLREAGHLPDEVLRAASTPDFEQATVQRRISRLVREFHSRSEYVDAAGAMVWLHTLRALMVPELREPGRRMWEQLARGAARTPEALATLEAATHRASPAGTLTACSFIPEDFAPGNEHG